MKKKLILYLKLILLTIFLFIIYKNLNINTKEYFNNDSQFIKSIYYDISIPIKSKTIILKNEIVNPYKFTVINKKSLNYDFIQNLRLIIPFITITSKSIQNTITMINKNNAQLGIITEDHMITNNETKNIRMICGLNFISYTLIVPLNSNIKNWKNLKKKIIGTSFKYSNDYFHLKKILTSLKYNEEDYTIVTGDIISILHQFTELKIDAVYYSIVHPNPLIKLYQKKIKINIIGNEGLDHALLKFYIPTTLSEKIDISEYKIKVDKNLYINTYGLRQIIVGNKYVSNKYVFGFLHSLINNLFIIKLNKQYLNQMSISSITYTLPNIKIHPGTLMFLKKYNYITNDSNLLCANFTGLKECTERMIKENSTIINNNLPDIPIARLTQDKSNRINFGSITL